MKKLVYLALLILPLYAYAEGEESVTAPTPNAETPSTFNAATAGRPQPAGKASNLLNQGIVKNPSALNQKAGNIVTSSTCVNSEGKSLNAGEAGFDLCMAEARNKALNNQNGYIYQNTGASPGANGMKPMPANGAKPGIGFQYKLDNK